MSNNNIALPTSLEDARITSLPSTAYYIPNFLTEAEEAYILGKVSQHKNIPPLSGVSMKDPFLKAIINSTTTNS